MVRNSLNFGLGYTEENEMKCPYCGAEVTGNVCEYCGSQIKQSNKQTCPECGG